jgi:hypothetical protein
MQITKVTDTSTRVIPLIAALPFEIEVDDRKVAAPGIYDPDSQITIRAGRDYSTCREDDSAGGIFSTKADTKKDD